jgi:nucleoside-diphosphate kinase
MSEEKVLIIIKPDALVRGLFGEVVSRLERKGLKVIGTKMARLSDVVLDEHYSHLTDKPFFDDLKGFMQSAPVILMVVSGFDAVKATRIIVGATDASVADAGTIRGDLALSTQSNLVHASDSVENGEAEVKRFFSDDELFEYERPDAHMVYSDKLMGNRS